MYTHDGTNRNNAKTEDNDEKSNRQSNDLPRHRAPLPHGVQSPDRRGDEELDEPGIEDDDPDYDYIRDNDYLQSTGGVTLFDRLDVQPWLEKEGRFSFVTSDARAQDLACFKHLAKGQ